MLISIKSTRFINWNINWVKLKSQCTLSWAQCVVKWPTLVCPGLKHVDYHEADSLIRWPLLCYKYFLTNIDQCLGSIQQHPHWDKGSTPGGRDPERGLRRRWTSIGGRILTATSQRGVLRVLPEAAIWTADYAQGTATSHAADGSQPAA